MCLLNLTDDRILFIRIDDWWMDSSRSNALAHRRASTLGVKRTNKMNLHFTKTSSPSRGARTRDNDTDTQWLIMWRESAFGTCQISTIFFLLRLVHFVGTARTWEAPGNDFLVSSFFGEKTKCQCVEAAHTHKETHLHRRLRVVSTHFALFIVSFVI